MKLVTSLGSAIDFEPKRVCGFIVSCLVVACPLFGYPSRGLQQLGSDEVSPGKLAGTWLGNCFPINAHGDSAAQVTAVGGSAVPPTLAAHAADARSGSVACSVSFSLSDGRVECDEFADLRCESLRPTRHRSLTFRYEILGDGLTKFYYSEGNDRSEALKRLSITNGVLSAIDLLITRPDGKVERVISIPQRYSRGNAQVEGA